eukprot:360599-Chlamydomonas_euryale.AAC.1
MASAAGHVPPPFPLGLAPAPWYLCTQTRGSRPGQLRQVTPSQIRTGRQHTHPDQAVSLLIVIAPIRPQRFLTADVPNVQLEAAAASRAPKNKCKCKRKESFSSSTSSSSPSFFFAFHNAYKRSRGVKRVTQPAGAACCPLLPQAHPFLVT